jgi:peptide/nickel transport system substrate-binding protein
MTHARGKRHGGRIHEAAALVAIVGLLIVVGSCRSVKTSAPDSSSSTLRVGVAQLSATNPIGGLRQLIQLLSLEGIVRIGEDGRFEPLLAEKWNVGSDRRSLFLTLRPNVRFHDGSPLNSSDLARLLPEGLRSFWGPLADEIEQIQPVDHKSIEIKFRRASPFLQEMLEVTIRKPGTSVVGTGPFMTVPDSTSILRPNRDYYLGPPRINEIQVTTFPTVRAAWAELLRNGTDMLWEVGPDAIDSLQSSTTVGLFTYTRHYQYVLAFNTHAPALRSTETRRALNLAINRSELIQRALNGHGRVSSGPIWPRYWALPTPVPRFDFDPENASRILKGMQRTGNRTAARFTCLVQSDSAYERIALEMKRQLQAVDVEMEVRAVSQDQLLEAERSRNFEAVLIEAVSGPTVLRLHVLWDSHGSGNPGSFGSVAVDAAFDRVSQAENEAAYREAVVGLQKAFIDDPPAIFLAWSERARAVSKRFAVPAPEAGRDVISTLRLWSPRNNDARLASRN